MPKTIDKELVTKLKEAKSKTMHFAFIAGGTDGDVLIVEKKPIPPGKINEVKKESGGKMVFKGRCLNELDTYVFEVPKDPPTTLAKLLKTAIKESAGLTVNTFARKGADLDESGEPKEETEATVSEKEETKTATIPDTPPLTAPPPGEGATQFAAHLKSLMPELQEAEAANHPKTSEAKLKISEANVFFRKKDFTQANALLTQAEGLIREKPKESTIPDAPPLTSGTQDGAANFAARLKTLAPEIQQAEAANHPHAKDAKLAVSEASVFFRKKDYAQADLLLDKAEEFIKKASNVPDAPPIDQAAHYTARMKTLTPVIQRVEGLKIPQAKDVKQVHAEAVSFAAKKQYDLANETVDRLEPMLKEALASAAKDGQAKTPPPITDEEVVPEKAVQKLQAAVQGLQAANAVVDAQITQLQNVLNATKDPELVEISKFGLNGLTGNFKVKLMASLFEVRAAKGAALQTAAAKALPFAAGLREHLDSDPRVAEVDKSLFKVPMSIGKTLGDALSKLETALDEVANA